MAVKFLLPSDRPLDLLGFGWSPLFESVLSMPVVANPKRTPLHLPWARRCRDLPADLLAEVHDLAGPFTGFVPGLFEVGLGGDRPAFDEELAAFRRLDEDLVAYELSLVHGGMGCGPPDAHGVALVHDAAYRDEVLARTRGEHPERLGLVEALFTDPAAVRERYARLLERYWVAAFAAEWDRILPSIEAEVTDGARALVTRGAPGLVELLLPEGSWDPARNAITIPRTWSATCEVAERGGLQLVPTVYGWPNVLIELTPPWAVSIFVPLRELRRPEVPHAADHEVAAALRALGDETRLQIARLVAQEPRSTSELAQLLALSDSAVSRHLKALDAAGIVTGQRDGYFVLYRLRPERISQLGGALRSALGIASPPAGEVPALPVSLPRRLVGRPG